MQAAKISVYKDGSARYAGRDHADIGMLLEVLEAEGSGAPPLQLAFEEPADYEAVGRIIYGLHRAGLGERLAQERAEAVDPRQQI